MINNVYLLNTSDETSIDISTKYVDRDGGYTSIVKTRIRRGDATQMAYISFV